MLTPEELRQIRRLQLQAGRRVDSLFAGNYRSAFRGRGMEFEDVRPYVPGDDVRHIDWKVTARTGMPFVKEFREERQQVLVLVLDISGSVGFGSGGRDGRTDKALQQARVGAALAHAATQVNDQVGLVAFAQQVVDFIPPRRSRGHAWRVIRTVFSHRAQQRGTDVGAAAEFLSRVLPRRAVVCFLSDFIDPRPWGRAMASLSRRHRVNAFVLHDPRELALPDVGLVELEDAETGQTVLVDAARVRGSLGVEARLQRLRRAGAHVTAVGTGDDPFQRLEEHFRRIERLR
ncbi:MAG: DUF58 domain-containing protein [Pseudomonadota bacterium]